MRLSYRQHVRFAAVGILLLFAAGCATQTGYLKLDPSLQKDVRTFNGVQYVPLEKVCDAYRAKLNWDRFANTVTIEKRGTAVLRPGSDNVLVNGSLTKLDRSVVMSGGALYLPVSFAKGSLGAVIGVSAYDRSYAPPTGDVPSGSFTIRTVVLDAGHGGRDPGALGRGVRAKEKEMTLALARRLKGILEGHGIRVVMTRESDVFVPLPKRSLIANRSSADIFVSVHINASRNRAMNGFECYYLSDATDDNARAVEARENASLKLDDDAILAHSRGLDATLWDMTLSENRRESADLAGQICGAVDAALLTRNRGIRSARFYVLKHTRLPAVLVECGYISNRNEVIKLKDEAYLDRMAEAVAKGIIAHKRKYETTEGFTQ